MAQRLRHFVLLVVALALATGIGVASVRAATMNFGTGTSGGSLTTDFVQDGITMSPLDNGETPTANIFNHWDRVTSGSFASSSDNNAAIHRGNNGEVVEFTFASGQFDPCLSG